MQMLMRSFQFGLIFYFLPYNHSLIEYRTCQNIGQMWMNLDIVDIVHVVRKAIRM